MGSKLDNPGLKKQKQLWGIDIKDPCVNTEQD